MMLLLPKILYGRYREVRHRLMRIARRMRRGEEWIPLVEEGGFLDVASTPGHIVGSGPSSLLGRDEHFQMWLLWALVRREGVVEIRDIVEDIFQRSLERKWAVLGLVMSASVLWLGKESRDLPFLAAVHEHWDDFIGVGRRYTGGSRTPMGLWDGHNTVMYVLANHGIDLATVPKPPSAADLAGYLRRLGVEVEPDGSAPSDR